MIWLPKGGSQQKDGRLYSRKCATNPLAIFESIRRQSTKNLKKKRETHNYSARRQRRRRRRHAVENKRRTVERNERCLPSFFTIVGGRRWRSGVFWVPWGNFIESQQLGIIHSAFCGFFSIQLLLFILMKIVFLFLFFIYFFYTQFICMLSST